MRLNHHQTQLITQHVALIFGADDAVWLFGSQLDDEQVGGDVDLFIDTPQRNGLRQIVQVKAALTSALGRPVDVVLRAPGRDPNALNLSPPYTPRTDGVYCVLGAGSGGRA